MSERNEIPLEEINIVGHKFTKQWQEPSIELDQNFLDMKKQLADKMSENFNGGNQPGNHPGNQPGNQGFPGNNGGQGGHGNQGGFGNQGGYGNQGGQQVGQGGYNPNIMPPPNNGYNQPPQQQPGSNISSNPYSGLSKVNQGPEYYQPTDIKQENKEKPK